MAGFENVILRALEKHDPATIEIRDQIYGAARKALHGMLEKSSNLTQDKVDEQLQRLELAIAEIESQHQYLEPQSEFIIPEAEEPLAADAPPMVVASPMEEPSVDDYWEAPPVRRRNILTKMLIAAILLIALGTGAWWVYDQKLFQSAAMRDTSVPNPPKVLEEESSSTQQEQKWLGIFDPEDPRGLITGEAVTAELGKDNDGAFIAISGNEGLTNTSVRVVVEPGVMETIRGKRTIFDLRIKSSGKGHQFVVTCQFRELGDCGRKRFTAGQAAQSFIFKTQLEDAAIVGADKSGFLSISTDVSGTGNSLDLYSIRVTAE